MKCVLKALADDLGVPAAFHHSGYNGYMHHINYFYRALKNCCYRYVPIGSLQLILYRVVNVAVVLTVDGIEFALKRLFDPLLAFMLHRMKSMIGSLHQLGFSIHVSALLTSGL